MLNRTLTPAGTLGRLVTTPAAGGLPGAQGCTAYAAGDGLSYRITPGSLVSKLWLSFDVLFDGAYMAKHCFQLHFHVPDREATFFVTYAVLPGMQARLRLPLSVSDLNRKWLPREGALIKPAVRGERVALEEVERLTIVVRRVQPAVAPLVWYQTPIFLTDREPDKLTDPLFLHGPLVDELGQRTRLTWRGKTRSRRILRQRLRRQRNAADRAAWPAGWSPWGGDLAHRVEPSGYFRTHHDGRRWWLVDPDGYRFWSSGMCCVGRAPASPLRLLRQAYAWLPPRDDVMAAAWEQGDAPGEDGMEVNHHTANLLKALGPSWYEAWQPLILGLLRSWGFNTIGAFSDWRIGARARFPYTRILRRKFPTCPMIFRDMPDVFDERFERDCERLAEPLRESAADPAMIGYFLENEPQWRMGAQSPALGMLFNTAGGAARERLAQWLRQKYVTENALCTAWGLPVTFEALRHGRWDRPLDGVARDDLDAFSALIAERYFAVYSAACRRVDPHHLNLGCRYAGIPRSYQVDALRPVDVVSVNLYKRDLARPEYTELLTSLCDRVQRPILSGEWHFGALESGLPGIANQNVRTQADRGRAFRVYQESAAALSCCVGTMYFRLHDNPVLGRGDGENYNIGFLDVCHRPYREMVAAARRTHERLYRVAAGDLRPYSRPPEYLGI